MKVWGVLGLLAGFVVIFLIDKPKIKATADSVKCSVVYCAVLAAGFLLGTLEVFNLLPTLNNMLIELYEKYLIK